eukprot:241140_1
MINTHYTVLSAYKLGDHYRNRGKLLAAELCYALPAITDHPINQQFSNDIIKHKLNDFIHERNSNNYQIPPKGVDIPTQALTLVKSFFAVWLNTEIKSDLIKRAEDHAHKRADALINIFNQVTNKYDNISKLQKKDIQDILNKWINTHVSKVNDWKGPSFNKLQYKKNTNKLTVVMEFKDYRKRCRNSQEDWFKKYDGKFFAQYLTEIIQIFDSRLLQKDIAIVKIEFAQKFLNRKIQFPLAAARSLLPAGTLFHSNELQIALNKFHKDLNAKYLKENSNTNKVKELHLQLLAICKKAYNSLMTNSRNIPAIIAPVIDNMDEDDSFTNNNIEMLNEEFRLENHSVRNSNMFTEIRNVEGKDNYMPQRQPVPVFGASLAPNQFRHFQMNPYYNTQPHNMTFLSQIQYPKSVSDTCTVSTCDSITPPTNNISIPQTNIRTGGIICTRCQEHMHQCRCNTRSNSQQIVQHYNPQQYYVNTHRQFQYSNGYLNPSQRIHNNMSIQNDRQQRRLNYHQQKKNTSTKTNISYTHDTKSSNSKMNTVREELKPEPAGKHQSIEFKWPVVKKKRKPKQELLEKSKQKEREEKNQRNNFLSSIKDDCKKCKNISEKK